MRALICATALSIVGSCSNLSNKEEIQVIKDNIVIESPNTIMKYANTITSYDLEKHLYTYASRDFEGRGVGTKGQKKAAEYLKNYYISQDVPSPFKNDNYFQTIPKSYLGDDFNDSENVLAYIKGSEIPEEIIIVSAHLDHEGIQDGEVYLGADDDGSGTVALLEMAQAFKEAKDAGFGPKRSILFLHTTAEEIGLQGSRYYTENPVFPIKNTVVNLNIDMIGRIDRVHEKKTKTDYLYLIGADRLSTELHYVSEAINNRFFNIELDYKFNDENDSNDFYSRSDHYNFAAKGVPVIFYFNGEHDDYHKPTDTPDKIEYGLLEKRTRLIFATAWQLANQKNRITVDK
ncbi:M20/M25/M40 family metallo-hydrolase [Flavobacteriaceae bacterium AU392]|nr:M20/M25/M40 family metallo-hydrolase [Flavobacteriaceae bacterium]RKM86499.1 M20/M25/M40 family metallo-hydrolase [Flavobacteriaceae bacterium AU392]